MRKCEGCGGPGPLCRHVDGSTDLLLCLSCYSKPGWATDEATPAAPVCARCREPKPYLWPAEPRTSTFTVLDFSVEIVLMPMCPPCIDRARAENERAQARSNQKGL